MYSLDRCTTEGPLIQARHVLCAIARAARPRTTHSCAPSPTLTDPTTLDETLQAVGIAKE